MKRSFKKWMNSYFYYQKGDRNAILIIAVLILLIITLNEIIKHIEPKSDYDYNRIEQEFRQWENNKKESAGDDKYLFPFNPNTISADKLDSLDIPVFVKQNIVNYRKAGGIFKSVDQLKKIYGMNDSIFATLKEYIFITDQFDYPNDSKKKIDNAAELSGVIDPNEADLNTLITYGFNRFQAENILKYRESGGIFKKKNDLLKVYGIDSVFYSSVERYLKVEEIEVVGGMDLILVELNKADSIQLLSLEGIGPVFAGRILKYRQLLGGFYTKSQLLEVYGFPVETYRKIENQLIVDTIPIHKIRINFAEYPELIRHPYLDKEQVNQILKFREASGAFKNLNEIKSLLSVDAEQFYRLQPYLTCR